MSSFVRAYGGKQRASEELYGDVEGVVVGWVGWVGGGTECIVSVHHGWEVIKSKKASRPYWECGGKANFIIREFSSGGLRNEYLIWPG